MRQYYYTVASLPALQLDELSPLSMEQFHEACDVELTDEDRAYVLGAYIRLEGDGARVTGQAADDPSGLLAQWSVILREFQQQAALIRAQNLGWEIDRMPRPDVSDAQMPERLRQILGEDSPLKRELAILRWLWSTAEQLETGHHFDREKLLLYHLKLQMTLRRARLTDSEAGNEEFEAQYNRVAESLMEIAT